MDIAIHKGGWRAIAWTGHAKTTVVIDEDGVTWKRVIAECDNEEVAVLLSAAPELLASAIALLDSEPMLSNEAQALRDAIAKATGKAA